MIWLWKHPKLYCRIRKFRGRKIFSETMRTVVFGIYFAEKNIRQLSIIYFCILPSQIAKNTSHLISRPLLHPILSVSFIHPSTVFRFFRLKTKTNETFFKTFSRCQKLWFRRKTFEKKLKTQRKSKFPFLKYIELKSMQLPPNYWKLSSKWNWSAKLFFLFDLKERSRSEENLKDKQVKSSICSVMWIVWCHFTNEVR